MDVFSKVPVNLGVCHDKKSHFSIFSFMPKKLRNGVGNTATVLKKFLHPKNSIEYRYANIGPQYRINDLVVVRKGTKTIKYKPTVVIFFIPTISQMVISTYHRGIAR